ncbi:DUF6790 family protein [Aestuariivirga litoralis]|uniref:DUF6790 family protein n=1 Tax=Aestuariivirga litoralis TaxID=2650924 RepID=UPI0018C637F3|nr:DUF6790 family protein [Aestuariivirga litoralis]MBG1233349.1 hypothetical protein [Aestuariivirga litoralis]
MYLAIVLLTMLVLPVASMLVHHGMEPSLPWIVLLGRWFVFWGVGARLGLAGFRQYLRPEFTARNIFHMKGDEALPLVKELGAANLAAGVTGLLSLVMPSFVLPAAIYALIFYANAGWAHVMRPGRLLNENIAMISDLFIALILAVYVLGSVFS